VWRRDTQRVAVRGQDRDMTIQLSCPWCTDEVAFTINEADEELVCSSCAMRMDFAPDPGVTFELLYAAVA
jgi:transcription elongation factor Elf1